MDSQILFFAGGESMGLLQGVAKRDNCFLILIRIKPRNTNARSKK